MENAGSFRAGRLVGRNWIVIGLRQRLLRSWKIAAIVALSILVLATSVFNAKLIFDDLYLMSHFARIDRTLSGWHLVEYVGLNPEARHEYRLYALSRLVHFGLWKLSGSNPTPDMAFIALTQVAAGYGISRLLRRAGADDWQANAAWAVWVFSAFAATSCFHYYSYLILPYQITVLCALVLRWRAASFLLGMAIALTGEAHLAASCLILLLGALASDRSFRVRLIDVAVPVVAIIATIIVHRLYWQSIVLPTDAARYRFGTVGWFEVLERTRHFARSILPGMTTQIVEVLAFSGLAAAGLAVVLVLGFALLVRKNRADGSNRIAFGLLAVAISSICVVWTLSAVTGQISPILPRRYGFVPYTLIVMTAAIFLLSPSVKAKVGAVPAMVTLSAAIAIWGLLQFVVLPSVRAQDQIVWSKVQSSLAAKGSGASVLLLSASNLKLLKQPHIRPVDSTPFRAPASDIAESAFDGFWWYSQYAIVAAGASFAAYRWEEVDSETIKLFGNEVNQLAPRVVRKSSMVVLFDMKKAPGDPRTVTVFTDWQKFEEALALVVKNTSS